MDCVQYWTLNTINLVVNSIKSTCDNKPKCRPIPSAINLLECGNSRASYMHVEYQCDSPTTATSTTTTTRTTTTNPQTTTATTTRASGPTTTLLISQTSNAISTSGKDLLFIPEVSQQIVFCVSFKKSLFLNY